MFCCLITYDLPWLWSLHHCGLSDVYWVSQDMVEYSPGEVDNSDTVSLKIHLDISRPNIIRIWRGLTKLLLKWTVEFLPRNVDAHCYADFLLESSTPIPKSIWITLIKDRGCCKRQWLDYTESTCRSNRWNIYRSRDNDQTTSAILRWIHACCRYGTAARADRSQQKPKSCWRRRSASNGFSVVSRLVAAEPAQQLQ